MKTFRVWAACDTYYWIDVEAETAEEAYEIAEEADGGDFEEDICSVEWRMLGMDMVQEIK